MTTSTTISSTNSSSGTRMTTGDPDVARLLPSPQAVRLLDESGRRTEPVPAVREYPMPPDALLLEAYRWMVVGRRFDTQATALVRQGRLAVYPSSRGQEACEVAAALVLRPSDWLFPTYRDCVTLVSRGIDPVEVLTLLRGDWHCGYDPVATRTAPQCTPLATQAVHAAGLAHGERAQGRDTVALAVIGDGATSEGDFHEALNFAAVFAAPVVFLVQNNRWAISVPLSRQTAAPSLAYKGIGYGVPSEQVDGNDPAAVLAVLSDAVERARRGGPVLVEAHTYRVEAHTNADDASRYRDAAEVQEWLARDPVARLEAHLRSTGALDDDEARRVAAQAESFAADVRERLLAEPVVDPLDLFANVYATPSPQLLEQRDRVVAELRAAEDEEAMTAHPVRPGPAPTAPTARTPTARTPTARTLTQHASSLTMAQALNAALRDALAADERVVVLGEDVGRLGGVFRVTDGLQAAFGEDRCVDTPLAEAGIVGFAVGMAMSGLLPVVELQFDAFAFPAFEQVVSHVAKLRNRTRGALALPMVLRVPYSGGIGGVEHHSDSSEAYWAHTPGLVVVTPSTPQDAYDLLLAAVRSPDPVVVLEPKKLYYAAGEVHRHAAAGPPATACADAAAAPDGAPAPGTWSGLAGAVVRRPGRDATVVAYGTGVPLALAAADAAAEEGRDLEVVDVRRLVPFDDATVTASVLRTGRCVVVHEASGFGGYGAEVAARVQERCFHALHAPVLRVTGLDVPYPPPRLEHLHLPDVDRLLDAVDRLQWDDEPDPTWVRS